jgi:hypothetical protein
MSPFLNSRLAHRPNHAKKATSMDPNTLISMIYIARDGAQHGPYPVSQINAMLAEGKLRPADLAWWEGCAEWVPVMKAEGVMMPQTTPPVASHAVTAAAATQAHAPSGAVAASVYAPPRGNLTPGATMAGQVSAGTVQALKETRPWVKFLAVLGMIGTVLMLLGGIGGLAAFTFAASGSSGLGPWGPGMVALMAVLYLAMALLYIYPILKLFKYSGAITRLSQSGSVRDLEDALGQQKSFWKFIGILTLIMVVIYLVFIILMVVGGVSTAVFMKGGGMPPGMPPSSFPVPAGPP